MNVSEQNNLTYAGHVEIFLEQDGKKELVASDHNAGNMNLFNFIAECLAGQWCNLQYSVPGRVRLLESGGPLGGLTAGTLYSSLPVVKANSVVFHFRIPSLYFTTAHTITGAQLLTINGDGSENSILADFSLSEDKQVTIPAGQTNITIIVNWTLTIENKPVKKPVENEQQD